MQKLQLLLLQPKTEKAIQKYGSKFDYYLGGISWPFCPTVLGMLIPKPGENFSIH